MPRISRGLVYSWYNEDILSDIGHMSTCAAGLEPVLCAGGVVDDICMFRSGYVYVEGVKKAFGLEYEM